MTINELIKSLEATPKERRNERVLIYIDGPFSGYVNIKDFQLDGEDFGDADAYNYVASERIREVSK